MRIIDHATSDAPATESVVAAHQEWRSGVDFAAWIAARGPALLRFAHALTGRHADAEDLVQEALIRVLPRWQRVSLMEAPEAYVKRVIVNAHTSRWRRLKREVLTSQVDDGSSPEGESTAQPLDMSELWIACRLLPHDQRTAIVLRFYEELTYKEIAELTGVRESTVRSRVARGVRRLKETVDEQ